MIFFCVCVCVCVPPTRFYISMTLMFIGLSLPQWQKSEGKHFLQPTAAMCTLHCTAFLYWDLQSQQISEKEVNLNNIFNIQVNRTILKNKLLLSIIYGTGEWGYFLDWNFLAEFLWKLSKPFLDLFWHTVQQSCP